MKPEIHESSYVARSAVIIGDVTIGKHCGVFPHAVIRGDENFIEIHDGCNVQDCCVIHTDKEHEVKIKENVSVGHGAIVHGAFIEENCIIGMHATILNGAFIRRGSIIGAHTLVTSNMEILENSLVVGVPGKVVKQDPKFSEMARSNAETYHRLSIKHLQGKYPYYRLGD